MNRPATGYDGRLMDLTGKVIDGRYELREPIGRGGMGVVYRARQLRMDRDVAVKLLQPDAPIPTKRAVGRFEREARVASKLQHPNAVMTFDFGESPWGLYLVMELLEGQTLAQRLEEGGPMAATDAAFVASSVAAALSEAHAKGIIHRDLKPANVFLHAIEGAEVVKVLDFGIAKFVDAITEPQAIDANVRRAGGVYETTVIEGMIKAVGSVLFMAPEQAEGGNLGPHTDLYALGVLMFNMFSGRPPFEADEPWDVLHKHVNEAPPELPAWVPDALRSLTYQLMSKSIAGRPNNAGVVVQTINQWLALVGHPAPAAVRVPSAHTLPVSTIPTAAPPAVLDVTVDSVSARSASLPMRTTPRTMATPTTRQRPSTSPLRTAGSQTAGAQTAGAPFPSWARFAIAGVVGMVMTVGVWAVFQRVQAGAKPTSRPLTPVTVAAAAEGIGVGSDPDDWVRVPAGTLSMGASASAGDTAGDTAAHERPQHRVDIGMSLWVKRTEVTRSEWEQLMGTLPSTAGDDCPECPVDSVSWWDSVAFCNALSRAEGRTECYVLGSCRGEAGDGLECSIVEWSGPGCGGYRLPTEAEWEYVATATSGGAPGGTQKNRLTEVSRAPANAAGIRGLFSNTSEWVWDRYSSTAYEGGEARDPRGPIRGHERVRRGCSYRDPAALCRPTARFFETPGEHGDWIGLRPVLSGAP
ncbi:MAG: serine/threonine protein kinase/formylglycine-generating enzyme required for sulfatase activity [Myxococcota bacterium]